MHDLHFLERLSRASPRETDRALSLYRDPELVRFLLDGVDLGPDSRPSSRVAIALGATADGPWAVVARDGGFVTCLAAGMDLGALPRLDHAQVAAQVRRHERLRAWAARWEVARAGEIEDALASLVALADRVPAETMVLLAPFTPLFAGQLFQLATEVQRQVDDAAHHHAARLRRGASRLRGADAELVRALWRAAWASGHCYALLGELPRDAAWSLGELDVAPAIAAPTLAAGFLPAVARALRFAARLGPGFVASCASLADADADAGHPSDALPHLQAAAVGLAAPEARAAAAALVAPPPGAPDTPSMALRAALHTTLTATPAPDAPSREPIDGPALRALVDHAAPVWGGPHPARDALPTLLGPLATAPLAALYRPRAALAADSTPWSPRAATLALFAPPTDAAPARPAAPRLPARNAPCPCGSGKKYKRCCGG